MRSICVYLGSLSGASSVFSQSVVLLGKKIAALNLRLVYGGSSLGTMGLLADTVKDNGGTVLGVITEHLVPKEKPSKRLDELRIVESMDVRKKMLQAESDMFLVMPGGIGTLEEASDTWNAIKLGLVNKPMGFFNLDGYFDSLFAFIATCEASGFVSQTDAAIPHLSSDIESLLLALNQQNQ